MLLPKTLVLLDEPFDARGDAYYSHSTWWRFARELARHTERMTLYVSVTEVNDPPDAHRVDPGCMRIVRRPGYRRLAAYYRMLPRTFRLLRRQACQLVAEHDLIICRLPSPASAFLVEAARRLSKPLVLLVCGDVVRAAAGTTARHWAQRAFTRVAAGLLRRNELRWARQAILVGAWGDELRDIFHVACPRTVVCESPSIEQRYVCPPRDRCRQRPIRLLRVGPIVPAKGIDVLIDSVRRLVDDEIDVTLELVGAHQDPAYVDRLRAQIAANALGDRIRFLGRLTFGDPLFERYRKADIHVVSSISEGIPRCILEARVFSLPTVSTAVGGIPTVIRDEQEGLLVPPNDAEALARAIRRVIEDDALRDRMAVRSHEIAQTGTLEFHAERLASLIDAAIGNHGPMDVTDRTKTDPWHRATVECASRGPE